MVILPENAIQATPLARLHWVPLINASLTQARCSSCQVCRSISPRTGPQEVSVRCIRKHTPGSFQGQVKTEDWIKKV